jgi:hypothetical protein
MPSLAMNAADELAELDAAWDLFSSDGVDGVEAPSQSGAHENPPESQGAFGHESERRLGLRVPAALWVLVKDGERALYARTVEVSPTSAVLKLLDGNETRFERARRFELDLFVPGAERPLHVVAWPTRAVGQLEAFEFLSMSSSDRLTLAEHLDVLLAGKTSASPPPAETRAVTPPVSWSHFVLSLQQSKRKAGASLSASDR